MRNGGQLNLALLTAHFKFQIDVERVHELFTIEM